MRRIVSYSAAALMAGFCGAGAYAWGPVADTAVVSAAVRVVQDDMKVQLQNLMRDVQAGATAGAQETERLMPNVATSPIQAIESEMFLLQAARGDRVDPYYAYRMGLLGKVVASLTTPLAESDSPARLNYMADADRNIESARIISANRTEVQAQSYFPAVIRQANEDAEMMTKDYESGLGFGGIAKASLAEDASRSVNAVADVFYTILKDRAVVATISQNNLRDYHLGALAFYLKRGNQAEANNAHEKLMAVDAGSPDLRKQIGDLYFEATMYEAAVTEYEAVLAVQPDRRDVVQRLAEYYLSVGDEAQEDGRLEAAETAYQKAADTDKLNPDAQVKLIKAKDLREDRDMRLTSASTSVDQAADMTAQAEQLAFNRDFGGAMEKLARAQELYQSVGDEFPDLARQARNGLFTIQTEMDKLRLDLVSAAPSLSGLGSDMGVRKLAGTTASEVSESALNALVDQAYKGEVDRLRREYEAAILSTED